MKILNIEHKVYLAAAIDFEGHISLIRGRITRTCIKCNMVVSVTNTCLNVLEYLQTITDSGQIDLRIKEKGYKQAYVWRLRVPEIEDFLRSIQPYLKIKNDQCSIMLEYITRNWANPLTEEDNRLRRIMLEEMAELNRKGTDD